MATAPQFIVSIKPSLLYATPITSYDMLEVNQVVHGYISSITKQNLFISLGHNINGVVPLTQVSKDMIDDIYTYINVGQSVTCSILKVYRRR